MKVETEHSYLELISMSRVQAGATAPPGGREDAPLHACADRAKAQAANLKDIVYSCASYNNCYEVGVQSHSFPGFIWS